MHRRAAAVAMVLALLAVMLVVASCGSGRTSQGRGTAAAPTAAPTHPSVASISASAPSGPLALNPPGSDTQGGLTLTVVGVSDAPPGQPYANVGIACDPVLVFAAPDPTNAGYSSNDLQAIRSYVTSIPLNESGMYPIPDNRAPAALKWVSAGQSDCAARLDLTNTSGATVTVSAVGLQLSASPAPNSYHYAQLDPCSISPLFGPCFNNGALYDQGYVAQVQIGSGGAGASFQGNVEVGDPTDTTTPLPLILANGDVKSITVRIFVQDAQAGTIYRVVPQLTVSDTTTHVVTFSGLTQTLVFATKSQISCYGLSGGAVVPSSQITYDPGYHSWC